MHTHPNARLTPLGRERLLRRHTEDHLPLSVLAAQAGISVRTAYKWLARYRLGGATALVDRCSVRRTQRRTLDPLQLQRAVDLRHERCTEVGAFYWTALAPDIVNSGREEQGSISV